VQRVTLSRTALAEVGDGRTANDQLVEKQQWIECPSMGGRGNSPNTGRLFRFEGYSASSECAREFGQAAEQSAKRERRDSIYLYIKTVYCCKSMKTRDFLMHNEPRYLTGHIVIPQFCGIYQS
jgi:hypothetical protein